MLCGFTSDCMCASVSSHPSIGAVAEHGSIFRKRETIFPLRCFPKQTGKSATNRRFLLAAHVWITAHYLDFCFWTHGMESSSVVLLLLLLPSPSASSGPRAPPPSSQTKHQFSWWISLCLVLFNIWFFYFISPVSLRPRNNHNNHTRFIFDPVNPMRRRCVQILMKNLRERARRETSVAFKSLLTAFVAFIPFSGSYLTCLLFIVWETRANIKRPPQGDVCSCKFIKNTVCFVQRPQ